MKKLSDEKVLETILNTRSLQEAAAELKISTRTLYTRTRSPEFIEMCANMQKNLNAQMTEALFEISFDALEVFKAILQDDTVSNGLRLQAAQSVLTLTEKFQELNLKLQPENPILILEDYVKKYIEPK